MTAASNTFYEQGLRLTGQGRHAEAIDSYQQALAAAPADPRVLFALGNTAKTLGMPQPAEMFYRQVLAIEPDRIEALTNLANLLRAHGQASAARALLEPALARNPQSAELLLTQGSVLREMGDGDAAEHCYREALELNPNYAPALGNLADMISQKGDRAEALSLYGRALKHDPDNAQAKLNRAILHLLSGDLKQGWRDYAARLSIPGKAPLCDHSLPRWTGGSLRNKRLLVTAEQGVGDQLMFASLLPDLVSRARSDGAHLVLECDPRLVPLFARSFPEAAVHASAMQTRGGAVHAHYGWLKAAGGANLAVEMGTLPRYLRGETGKFPDPNIFLDADEVETLNWQRTLMSAAPGPYVGICWRSGKRGGGRDLNFAPIEMWAEFIARIDATPVCVQYDATDAEIETLCTLSGKTVVVPGGIDQKQELDRACALMAALDAVVTAPTAVSWLSAGTGVATYKVLRAASWTAFGGGHELFAPAAICVAPERSGDWTDCFARIAEALSRQL